MYPTLRRLRLLTLVAGTALTLAACGTDTEDAAVAAPTGEIENETESQEAPAGDVSAADLKVTLNNLLAEHVFFAGAAVNEALQGNEAGFEAAAAATDENSVALSQAVGLAYGPEAGEAFLGLWRSHIGMFVDYTQAVAAGDQPRADAAIADLTGYATDFAVFLNGANENLPVETVEGLVKEHALTTKAAIDALAAGDPVTGLTNLRTAMGHMHNIADPLSGAIVAQSPDTFAGDVDAESTILRRDLNLLLREHTFFAGAAVNEALRGNTAAFEAAAGVLDTNSQDLAGAIGSVYGPEAGEAFLGLWRSHIGMFVDYTEGVAAGDEARKQGAVDDLMGYATDFAVFLNGANENLPVETVEGLVKEHVITVKAAVDAIASGEGNPFVELRTAGGHMSMIADPLAGAIAQQQGLS